MISEQEYYDASFDVNIKNSTSSPSVNVLFAAVKEEYFNSDILFLRKETRAAASTLPDSVLEQLFKKHEAIVLHDLVLDDKCSKSDNYDGDAVENDEAIVLPDSILDDICFDFDALETKSTISNTVDDISSSSFFSLQALNCDSMQ